MTEWLTPADVARELQVSPRTVGRWIERGDLPALRVDSIVRISRQALAEWQRRHETTALNTSATEGANAPAATVRSRPVSPLPFGPLPDGYTPVFGDLRPESAARPAVRRSGSAARNGKAV